MKRRILRPSALTRREFLRASAAAAAAPVLAPLAGAPPAAPAGKKPPNIVLIMADDLGYECLGCNGGQSYETPNLDALAAAGTRFEHCYCTPLCTPSRVEIMTGQYPFRNGWPVGIWTKPAAKKVVDPATPTFARMLKDSGYATAVAGKWQLCEFNRHPNHPRDMGFDAHCLWTWTVEGKRQKRYWNPAVWQDGKRLDGTTGKYGPDLFTDYLIDFISRSKDGPFLAYYPMALVHSPFIPTPDSRGQAKGDRRRGGGKQANFAAMVAYMDKLVGRLVGHLQKLGLRERTLVLFTGDNGTPGGIRTKWNGRTISGGKGSLNDRGSHVPLIAARPGTVAAGKVCEDLVDFSDVLPTLAEVAGAKPPTGHVVDGRSFAARLGGGEGKPRDWVYVQLGNKAFVRETGWKLFTDGRLVRHGKGHYDNTAVTAGQATPADGAARERLAAVLKSLRP